MIRTAVLLALVTIAPATARAQQTVSDVVTFLMTNQAVQTDNFGLDRAAAEVARDTIARALLVNLTSVPLATSSSGFLYRLNPELGTVERATESFGGFFVERALTAGRGRASFGMSGTTSSFDHLNGQALRTGTLLTVANQFEDEPVPFNTESLTLRITSSSMTFFGSLGVTDRLEVGAAIPLVSLNLEGQRVNIYRGTTSVQGSGEATASGLADVALRAKYTVVSGAHGGVAGAAEFRLPTGDEANLLGAGSASYRFMAIGSFEGGRLGVHGNAGLVRGGISNEMTFGGAASFAMTPRMTVSGEVIARHVTELRDIVLASQPHPEFDGVETLRLVAGTSGSTLANAIAGVKWNVSNTFVLGGHLAWSLSNRGLTAPLTPSLAIEYAF
jgi:hypothetical protein